MKKLLTAVLASIGLAAPVQANQAQENAYVSQPRNVAAFEKIRVSGTFKVTTLVSDGPAQVILTGPPSMIADTIAEVDGGTLSIRFREGASWSWNPGSGMHVLVKLPSLLAAELHGAGELEISQAKGDLFEAVTTGAGSITVKNMNVGAAHFATRGAGSIIAEGTAGSGRYATAGAGSIDAKRLRVMNADIAVGGSGSIYADVSELADVAVNSSGSADIVGGAQCNATHNGAGRIDCR